MKVIDFEKVGNVVRLYVGEDSLESWWGDDWDDAPYEHNAGTVYEDKFCVGHVDVAFPIGTAVAEPCDGHLNSRWCKDDMVRGDVACLAVKPGFNDAWGISFGDVASARDAALVWFGDDIGKAVARLEGVGGTVILSDLPEGDAGE